MKKTALLIDGGWFCRLLGKHLELPHKWPTAAQVVEYARSVTLADEEVLRIFYYDCAPFDGQIVNPVDGSMKKYGETGIYRSRTRFLDEIGAMDYVALRLGELKERGWDFSDSVRKRMLGGGQHVELDAGDIRPNFEQKGVDMRIGMDVASLSIKRQVERIILFSGDSDMIPALKLARREGIQVFVVQVGDSALKKTLVTDSDGCRKLSLKSLPTLEGS
jgi:uncharacterized LabA/DUF88 family protein